MITRTWRRTATLIGISLGMVCAQIGPGQASDWPGKVSLEDAARAFDDAALRVDTSPAIEIARWTRPIYLSIAETSGMADHAAEVEATVRSLAAITRVSVTRVAWGDSRANFIVRANASDYAGKSPCRSSVDWTDLGHMVRAEIFVNMANPARITRCITHESMHGFGFRGHAHASFSVLSYKYAGQAQLTDTDRLMLEALYDPRLKTGMKVAAASPVACGIMAEKLRASPDETAALCGGRGSAPAKRELVAFGGSRRADQQASTASGLQPGYRDGGH
jgi:hypothetical protein